MSFVEFKIFLMQQMWYVILHIYKYIHIFENLNTLKKKWFSEVDEIKLG